MNEYPGTDRMVSRLAARAVLRTKIERRRERSRTAFLFLASSTVTALGLSLFDPEPHLAATVFAVFAVITGLMAAAHIIALLVSYRDVGLWVCAAVMTAQVVGADVFDAAFAELFPLAQFGLVAVAVATVLVGLIRKSVLDEALVAEHDALVDGKEATDDHR